MRRKKRMTSKRHIIYTMMIFIIPLIIFLFSYNIYMIRIVNSTIAEAGQNVLYVYQNPIEKELHNIENAMVEITANDVDFGQLVYSSKRTDVVVHAQSVIKKMKTIFSTANALGGSYIYHKGEDFIQEMYNKQYSFAQKQELKEILKQTMEEENVSQNGWITKKIGEKYFLVRIFNRKDAYIASFYDLDGVDKPQFYKNNTEDSFLFFADLEWMPLTSQDLIQAEEITLKEKEDDNYYITGNNQRYLVVQSKIDYAGLNLMYAVPYYGSIITTDKAPFLFLTVSIFIVFLIAVSFRSLEKSYLNPFKELIDTMENVKSGNIEAKMMSENHILEFGLLADTFNEMMGEIKLLKISAYEYKIETQQAKLQYLQIQIRPHFFLNCLKNLYSLAQEKRYEQIQDTILALSEHLRFILKDNFSLVAVEKEIQSVKNYILLQQLTSFGQVSCEVNVDARLSDYQIPPLSILTFIENSIKHAQTINKQLKMQVRVGILEGDREKFVNITILDNGSGFSEDSLRELNQSADYCYQEQHVGIQNVKHRFALIYNNACTFCFSNVIGGASIEIFIPVEDAFLE